MNDIETQAAALLSHIIENLSTLNDNHKQADREWFQKLLNCNKGESNLTDIEAGITINITIIDCIVTKLLDMDFRQLAKIKIVKDYISQIWSDNGHNTELLHSHIIEDSKARDFYEAHSTPIKTNIPVMAPVQNTHVTTIIQEINSDCIPPTYEHPTEEIVMKEKLSTNENTIEEILMAENDTEEQTELLTDTEYNKRANIILGHDILTIRS